MSVYKYYEQNHKSYLTNQQCEALKQIINETGPAESVLSTCMDFRVNFINQPSETCEIFDPLKKRISKFQQLIKDNLQQTPIEPLLNELINDYNLFISQLVEKVIYKENSGGGGGGSSSGKKSLRTLESNPLILGEDLIYREISLDKAYEIASYNPKEYEYQKKNENGTSCGGVVNSVYYKVDNGSHLLRPAKENAVFQFYKSLFDTDKYIVPSQLLVINQLPILPPDINDSEERRELIKLKTTHCLSNARDVFNIDPLLERRIENALQHQRSLFIQGSLFIEGLNLQEFLRSGGSIPEENYNKIDGADIVVKESTPVDYSCLDRESFSAHILASLLLMPTDYKADNLVVSKDSNIIVGIDNDEAMECDEVKKVISSISTDQRYDISLKNVLFSLPLMGEYIHEKIISKFMKHHPNIFLLEWLIKQCEKEIIYNQLIKTSLPIKINNNINNNNEEKIISNINQDLGLPFKFLPGWIKSMLGRFIMIKRILKASGNRMSHQELLKQIFPFTGHYYQALERLNADPIEQMISMYGREFDFKQLLSNYLVSEDLDKIFQQLESKKFTKWSPPNQTLQDTIKELLLETNYGTDSFQSNQDLIRWLEILLIRLNSGIGFGTNDNDLSYRFFELHDSWYKNKEKIFIILIREGASEILIKGFAKIVHLSIDEINQIKDDDVGSITHIAIHSNSFNILSQIKALHSMGVDIEESQSSWCTPLGLSVHNKNFELFKLLIDLGAGALTNPQKINEYYKSLPIESRQELRPYLSKLSYVNPKIIWKISLDHLFPLVGSYSGSISTNGNKILKTTSEGERVISLEHWRQLFHQDGSPIKSNPHGARVVPFVKSKGFRIYCKFEPQFPGTELAVSRLSELLFGYLSPYCELSSINNTPVLLTQGVVGDTLVDVLSKNPELLNSLDPSNISKILVSAMLFNPGDGNLGNYIVSPCLKLPIENENSKNPSNKQLYRIIAIDQDQSFMPSFSKELGSNKLSLQVETVLFLFKQMNDPVHQDVIDDILEKNLDFVLNNWLNNLKFHHQASINHFGKISGNLKEKQQQEKKTIIGVSFAPGIIQQLFSKLTRLQNEFKKNRKKPITHIELLEILEPMIAIRYKPFLNEANNGPEFLIEKFINLKKSSSLGKSHGDFGNISSLSSSIHPNSYVLESIEIPDFNDIQTSLRSGKLGPDEAIKELDIIKKQQSTINQILLDLGQLNHFLDNRSLSQPNTMTSDSLSNSGSRSVNSQGVIHVGSNGSLGNSVGNKFGKLFGIGKQQSFPILPTPLPTSIEKKRENLTDCLLEQLLKEVNFSKLSPPQEKYLLDFLKTSKELRFLSLKGASTIKSQFFKSFIIREIVRMDLSDSSIDSISQIGLLGTSSSPIVMPSLIQLRLDRCPNLFMLKLNSDALKELSCTDCPMLKIIELNSPSLEVINLENGSIIDSKLWDNLSKQTKLLKLNISSCKTVSRELTFSFPNLSKLVANKISTLDKVILQLPSVLSVHFESCIHLTSITGIAPLLKSLNLNQSISIISNNEPTNPLNRSNNSIVTGGGGGGGGGTTPNSSGLSNSLTSSSSNINISSATTTVKVNICGVDKHIQNFRKLINSSKTQTNYQIDNIRNQDYDFQFWYLAEQCDSSTTPLYLRSSNLLLLLFDFSLDIDGNEFNQTLIIFQNYIEACKINSIKQRFVLFGYGFPSDPNSLVRIHQFKELNQIETYVYIPQIFEKHQLDYVKDSLFSNLRNDQLEILKVKHLYNFKKNIEKQVLQNIANKLLSKDVLVIDLLDELEGIDFSDIVSDYFQDYLVSIIEIFDLLLQLNKSLIENHQRKEEYTKCIKKDFFKVKIIQKQQTDMLSKLDRYKETMNISMVFKNLKRLYYLALIKNIGKVIQALSPIFLDYKMETYQKKYFEDDEFINFSFKLDSYLYSSSNSINIILCRVVCSGHNHAFRWYLIKYPQLFDEATLNSNNLNNSSILRTSGSLALKNEDSSSIEFPYDKTPLSFAIDYKYLEIIQWLVNNNLLSVKLLNISLIRSIIMGNLELVQFFIQNNADVNCSISSLDMTPIQYAAKYNQVEIIKYLLSLTEKEGNQRVKIEKKNKLGWSAIHFSSKNQNQEIIDLLISASNDKSIINSPTDIGETPLYLAATKSISTNYDFCWYLINNYKPITTCHIDGIVDEIDIISKYLNKTL
ncbi:hypothetical protein RB653_006209 [Dictyostelium firmibasis]|uniref:Ankyrin repeat-containing protein n=1 Tax=Dictyostelium firmibasis TaxID=79012 RepID=A0AAN7UE23_9MYCE